MDTGRFQYIQGTGKREHLTLGLVWDSFNFVECLLVYQECQASFSASWIRSSKVCHMLQYILMIFFHLADEGTHKAHLMEVFDRLATAGELSRIRNVELAWQVLLIWGTSFQQKGWHLTSTKFKQCKNGQFPALLRVRQQLLGLASYYRRYIECFSHTAAPLHALTQKNAKFCWTEACQQAFTTLKQWLI